MNNEQKIIAVLREIAGKSKLAASVFYLFAVRERARSRLTLRNLMLRMKVEGFTFDKTDYNQFFNLLADLQIGQLERGQRGQVKALRDINFTLQSVGKAAVSKIDHLVAFKPRGRLRIDRPEPPFRPGLTIKAPSKTDIKIMVTVNSRPWYLDVPKDYTEEDIAKIICMLNKN